MQSMIVCKVRLCKVVLREAAIKTEQNLKKIFNLMKYMFTTNCIHQVVKLGCHWFALNSSLLLFYRKLLTLLNKK